MLYIWTSANVSIIDKTLGKSLKAMRPHTPDHKFIPFVEGMGPPKPAAGDVVLVCGTKTLDVLQRAGIAPKNRTVNSLREKPIFSNGGNYLVTFDPNITSSEPEQGQTIDWDVRLATRLMTTGSMKPEIGKYQWVNSFADEIAYIEAEFKRTGSPVDVALDTETMGFYPWYPDRDIVTLQLTVRPKTASVLHVGDKRPFKDLAPDIFEQISYILQSPKVKLRGANLKFDLIWIAEKWGILCTNFKFDSMLVGSLLDENRSNSLNMHAKIMTTMGGYDDSFDAAHDKGHMEAIPANDDFLTYAGGDTDACQRVSDVLRDQLTEDGELARFYIKILHPAARAFEKLERRGVVIDIEKFHVLADDLKKTIKENQDLAMSLLPIRLKIKYRDKIDDQMQDGKNPLVPSLLKSYFFTPYGLNLTPKMKTGKTEEPSMAKAHLKMFSDTPEAMAMLDALTTKDQAEKTLSTFVEGFLKHLRPDGRLHPTYYLAHAEFDGKDEDSGTVTGRLSAKDPAFQIIPKKTKWAKRIRECYIAPKGKVVLQLDYSQGELRVVACVAGEKNMIAAYEKGMDLHSLTGSSLAKVPYDEFISWKNNADEKLAKMFASIRDRAKPANFGLLYGMGVEGFQNYAWASYGLKLTYAEAEEMRNLFFQMYPGLLTYHSSMRQYVNQWEYVRSPLGRVRHLSTIRSWDKKTKSSAERQAINSPIQSTLSDMMLWSIAKIDEAYPNDEIAIVGTVHDSLIAYVDEDKVELRAQQAQEIMSNLPFHEVGWNPVLKFPADAEYGLNLAHLSSIKLAA